MEYVERFPPFFKLINMPTHFVHNAWEHYLLRTYVLLLRTYVYVRIIYHVRTYYLLRTYVLFITYVRIIYYVRTYYYYVRTYIIITYVRIKFRFLPCRKMSPLGLRKHMLETLKIDHTIFFLNCFMQIFL